MLSILLKSLKTLNSIREKWAPHYERLGCVQIRDLLFHYPSGILDRSHIPPLHSIKGGETITQIVTVHEHRSSKPYSRTPYKIICSNQTGTMEVVYFRSNPAYLRKCYPTGQQVLLSGKVEPGINAINMVHPDIVTSPHKLSEVAVVEPVYPLTYGLSSRGIRMAVKEALALLPEGNEWIPSQIISQYNWPSWYKAIINIHSPQSEGDIIKVGPAFERLAFDEILASQLALQIRRRRNISAKVPLHFTGDLAQAFHQLLPFELTESQQTVVEEITRDQRQTHCMMRMLQGDVGSGKTVVAITAMLNAIEAGRQAVLMVPTEILAKQHYKVIQEYCAALNIAIECLLGSDVPKQRAEKLEKISNGHSKCIVGTHALFQEQVIFADLGLVIIDEQHRFGVEQRVALKQKGGQIDLLMMSATPIPRTLNMIAYGDLDISTIKHKPSNRQPIITSVLSVDKILELVERVVEQIQGGAKVYWICPLVDESEKINLTNVTTRYETLSKRLPEMVGLVHGQMRSAERDRVMQDFISGQIKLLVATTVIEVGVDVPDATIMIIEHSERFGLAQLHQLRGRVGRGPSPSQCILLYKAPTSQLAKQRLQAMRASNDGFYIAEQDLMLRGGGEVLGTKQSGLPEFRTYDLFKHAHLLELANRTTHAILEVDPELSGVHQTMRELLMLHGYDKKLELVP